jgi:hypothetical protein
MDTARSTGISAATGTSARRADHRHRPVWLVLTVRADLGPPPGR